MFGGELFMEPQYRNGDFKTVSGGTASAVQQSHDGVLHRVLVGGTYVGTIEFYDSATVAGTAAGNLIWSLGIPNTSFPHTYEIGANLRSGLVYTATGTPVLTFIYS